MRIFDIDFLRLTLVLLNSDIFRFETKVDSDQLFSQKQTDQDLHCFLLLVNTC